MSTEWFNKIPGSDVAQSQEDERMLLLGVGVPDWVRVPADTGHGGQYRCLAVVVGRCPRRGHNHQCRHYILDGPVCCAECQVDNQFLWYRTPAPNGPEP